MVHFQVENFNNTNLVLVLQYYQAAALTFDLKEVDSIHGVQHGIFTSSVIGMDICVNGRRENFVYSLCVVSGYTVKSILGSPTQILIIYAYTIFRLRFQTSYSTSLYLSQNSGTAGRPEPNDLGRL